MSDLEPFPELIEGRRLDAARIDGVDPPCWRSTRTAMRWSPFPDEVTKLENVLGVYLIDPDGTIRDPEIVFARIEHADPVPGRPLRPAGRRAAQDRRGRASEHALSGRGPRAGAAVRSVRRRQRR